MIMLIIDDQHDPIYFNHFEIIQIIVNYFNHVIIVKPVRFLIINDTGAFDICKFWVINKDFS